MVDIPAVPQWPHHADVIKSNVVTFTPVIATVAKIFDKNRWGCSFQEDTNKDGKYTPIWEMFEGTPDFDVQPGLSVKAWLALKQGDKRTFYNLNKLELASVDDWAAALPAVSPPAPATPPPAQAAAPADPTRASIEKQVYYKDFNPDAVAMLVPEQQAAMLAAYYATAMELISHEALRRAVEAYRALADAAREAGR